MSSKFHSSEVYDSGEDRVVLQASNTLGTSPRDGVPFSACLLFAARFFTVTPS